MNKKNITDNLFTIHHVLHLKMFFCILNIFVSFTNNLNAFHKKTIEINKHNMCHLDQLNEDDASDRVMDMEMHCEFLDKETYSELHNNKLYPIFVLKDNPDKIINDPYVIFPTLNKKIDIQDQDEAFAVQKKSANRCNPNIEIKDYCVVIDQKFISSNDSLSTIKNVCLRDPLYDDKAIYQRLLWANQHHYLNSKEVFNLILKDMYPSLVSLDTYQLIKDPYSFFEKNECLSRQELYIHGICPKQ